MATNNNLFNKRIGDQLNHLFDGSDFNVYNNNIINLSVGAPGPDSLAKCSEYIKIATEHRMEYERNLKNYYIFQYGPTLGSIDYRMAVSKFLTKGYNNLVHSEDIVLTCGATHGLHLVLSTLLDLTNGVIFVDDVTYMIALDAIASFPSIHVCTVPMTEAGVNVKVLKQLIQQYKFESKSKLFWGIYYTIPTYHNPTGIVFSEGTCVELVRLAREFDVLILCDDVYNLLSYSTTKQPPKRLYEYDNFEDINFKGNVISNGSFSKILAPGIRCGWMECPPRCIELFRKSGILKSGGATNHYTSGIITSMIELGLAQKQLQLYVDRNRERMVMANDILKKHLPSNCQFHEPEGGYFFWIQLPSNIIGSEFNQYLLQNYQVQAISGNIFSADNKFKNYIRVSVAFHPVERLEKALLKLCTALRTYIE